MFRSFIRTRSEEHLHEDSVNANDDSHGKFYCDKFPFVGSQQDIFASDSDEDIKGEDDINDGERCGDYVLLPREGSCLSLFMVIGSNYCHIKKHHLS